MGDIAVENPANSVAPHKKAAPADAIPNIDSLEGSGTDTGDEYVTLKRLQRHLEYVACLELRVMWPVSEVRLWLTLGAAGIGTSTYKKNTSRMSRGMRFMILKGSIERIAWLTDDLSQELEERTRSSAGGDQADTECATGYWTVYGGDRSEVCWIVL